MGNLKIGNKGGVQTILKIGKTLLEFTNCHLASGYSQESILDRSKHLKELLLVKQDYLFQTPIKYSFILGDTNFKVPLSKSEFMEHYKKNKECWIDFKD